MRSNASGHLSAEEVTALERALLTHTTVAAAARAVGVNRSTAKRHAKRMREEGRLGAPGIQPEGVIPEPALLTQAEIHDAAFWRKKAKAAEKQALDAEHIVREMAGLFQRDLVMPEWAVPSATNRGRAAGLIHLSDLHVGEVVRSEEIGGVNEYSPEVFQRRIRRMFSAACHILPRWSADCDLQGVVIALNGDLISGDIHDELRRTNALTAHEQVALAADELAAGISAIADKFQNVMVTVTPGNHGRSTEKTHAKRMAALSYDTMIGNILAREFKSDARITINIASGADLLFPIFGWSILQTHGDSMGTGGGQGFAGPELPIVRGGKKVRLAGFATGEHYDVILTAHYHTSSNPGTVLANGSVIGFNEYAVRIRAVPEPPQQWLALIHEKWGMRERVPVVLEDPATPQRPRVRVPAGMR